MSDIRNSILNVLAIAFIALLFVFAFTWIIFDFQGSSGSLKDTWSIVGSVFGGAATLSAAYIASLLFNDWRDEKNYDLENNLLRSILMDLKPLYVELLRVRSDSLNLKRIETAFIVKSEYIERNRPDLFTSIIMLFPNIKIYSEIKNDQTLINLYNEFDKHCYCFEHFFRILFLEKYKIYYEAAIKEDQKTTGNPPSKHYNIFQSYPNSMRDKLETEIHEVLVVFKKNGLEAEIGEVSRKVTYEDWLQETIDLHNQIQDYCIKGLKILD